MIPTELYCVLSTIFQQCVKGNGVKGNVKGDGVGNPAFKQRTPFWRVGTRIWISMLKIIYFEFLSPFHKWVAHLCTESIEAIKTDQRFQTPWVYFLYTESTKIQSKYMYIFHPLLKNEANQFPRLNLHINNTCMQLIDFILRLGVIHSPLCSTVQGSQLCNIHLCSLF